MDSPTLSKRRPVVDLLGWDHPEDCADARRRGYPTWEDKTTHAVQTLIPANRPLLEKVGAIFVTRPGVDRTLIGGLILQNSHCATEMQMLKLHSLGKISQSNLDHVVD
jgi:hypothetical protein